MGINKIKTLKMKFALMAVIASVTAFDTTQDVDTLMEFTRLTELIEANDFEGNTEILAAVDDAFAHIEMMSAVDEAMAHVDMMTAMDDAMEHVEMLSAIDDAMAHVDMLSAIDDAI